MCGEYNNNVLPTIFGRIFGVQLDVMPTYQNFVNDNIKRDDGFLNFQLYRVGYHQIIWTAFFSIHL